jgi:hypothetical protein
MSIHRWVFAVTASLALAAPLSAQWQPRDFAEPVRIVSAISVPEPIGDFRLRDSGLPSGLEVSPSESSARTFVAPVLPGQTRESENVAFMIVGGAALVVGSVIDGDAGTLMMVGGGVVGLIGLFRYLR